MKIFINNISDKEFIFIKYKELLGLSNKKTATPKKIQFKKEMGTRF